MDLYRDYSLKNGAVCSGMPEFGLHCRRVFSPVSGLASWDGQIEMLEWREHRLVRLGGTSDRPGPAACVGVFAYRPDLHAQLLAGPRTWVQAGGFGDGWAILPASWPLYSLLNAWKWIGWLVLGKPKVFAVKQSGNVLFLGVDAF